MHDLLTALSVLHAKHICHNDIKQENILLEEIDTEQGKRPHAVLADFGHSYDDDHPHILRQSGGTPGYRSIEKRRSQSIRTHHAVDTGLPGDIWALGVVFYELYRKLPADQQNKKLRDVLDPFLGNCGFSKDKEGGGYVETCTGFGGRHQSKKPSVGELIANMLQHKPEDRLTVQEALAMLDSIRKNV